jgi:hypothetical protein
MEKHPHLHLPMDREEGQVMARNWEEMLSDPIEGEEYKQEGASKLYETAYGLVSAEELDKIEREVNY